MGDNGEGRPRVYYRVRTQARTYRTYDCIAATPEEAIEMVEKKGRVKGKTFIAEFGYQPDEIVGLWEVTFATPDNGEGHVSEDLLR